MSIFVRSFVVACVLSFLTSANLFSMDFRCDEDIKHLENFIENRQRSPKKQKVNDEKTQPSGSFKVNTLCAIKSFSEVDSGKLLSSEGTTIALYDIDKTIVCPKFHFHNFMDDEKNKILDEFFNNKYFDGNKSEFIEFRRYLEETQKNYFSEYYIKDEKLVEESIVPSIEKLKERGAIIVGLTARKFLIAEDTDLSLKSLGIDFSILSRGLKIDSTSFLKKINMDIRGGFQNGIFYTGNQVSKVTLIPEIVNSISEKLNVSGPFTVYHFEDSEIEIQNFYNLYGTRNLNQKSNHQISVYPYYYTGHEEYVNSLKEKLNPVHQEIDEELVEKYVQLKKQKKGEK